MNRFVDYVTKFPPDFDYEAAVTFWVPYWHVQSDPRIGMYVIRSSTRVVGCGWTRRGAWKSAMKYLLTSMVNRREYERRMTWKKGDLEMSND